MLPLIFVMPVVQLLILSNAATFEVKHIRMHIIDFDRSSFSRELTGKFYASPYFEIVSQSFSQASADFEIQKGQTDLILQIPDHFQKELIKEKKANVLVSINAIDGAAAGVEYVYVASIIENFNRAVSTKLLAPTANSSPPKTFSISSSFWFNPELNYKTYMVPGILVMLVTMVALFLAGMNIVREKEIGTLEQINVTPIKKYQFIIGKLLPFWLLGLFELCFGLLIGKLVFHIPILGNIGIIFLFATVYLFVVLGMGFFISNFTDTQQQAMFLSWFFMVIFILMSGLFTSIESMPPWAQAITNFNPIRYFVEVMRMVMLKGAGLRDIYPSLLKLSIYAIVMNTLAVLSYKKTS